MRNKLPHVHVLSSSFHICPLSHLGQRFALSLENNAMARKFPSTIGQIVTSSLITRFRVNGLRSSGRIPPDPRSAPPDRRATVPAPRHSTAQWPRPRWPVDGLVSGVLVRRRVQGRRCSADEYRARSIQRLFRVSGAIVVGNPDRNVLWQVHNTAPDIRID